jgi:hypothetical protein
VASLVQGPASASVGLQRSQAASSTNPNWGIRHLKG